MKKFIPLIALSFILSSCAATPPAQDTTKPALSLTPVSFDSLNGWGNDDFENFGAAYDKSCARILKSSSGKTFGPLPAAGTFAKWQDACRDFKNTNPKGASALQRFFETRFTPHQILSDGKAQGLFTGYYEASLKGSKTKTTRYNIPLHKRSEDLVTVQLGDFRDDLKGRRIAGRVVDGKLKPYETRADIVAGDYPHNDDVLVWLDNAVDAFFVQIQGSGIVELADGGAMRIGYAGQNGHPYYAIGRELIARGEIEKRDISLQSIRKWLEENPSQADEIMNTNASYVFFTALSGEGPIGGEGVALTAGRSLAIDRSLLSYGMPIWTDIVAPLDDMPRLQKMMMTQDTGGAIRGPVRGDVFWGHGEKAERAAGPMKSKGQYWVLLPN